jgi:hypothetical protein
MEEGLMDGGVAAFTLENASDEFETKWVNSIYVNSVAH